MEFSHAIFKETLRFYTPAPGTFTRIANQDYMLGDIKIVK